MSQKTKRSDNRRLVVLHSGGLDSTVCLLLAIEKGKRPVSLGIDYGQKHRIELEYAYRQCAKFGIERKVIKVEWEKPLRKIPVDRSLDEIRSGVSPAFLPGRNVIFLTLGCAEAVGIGATEVWTGINSIDYSGYPDCTPEFVNSFSDMLRFAMPKGPTIVAPLLKMTKPEIAREAYRLGLRQGEVWYCYMPTITKDGVKPCGHCDACIIHKYAWDALHIDE